jgi:hypothetical protein
MPEVCSLIWLALVGAFRSRVSLEAENTILRHQLNVLRRKSPKRPTFGMLDRLIFAGLYRSAPKVLGALAIVKPETVIKWHPAGFRSYWRWKSRRRGGLSRRSRGPLLQRPVSVCPRRSRYPFRQGEHGDVGRSRRRSGQRELKLWPTP